ncbi:MAG: PilZ domain-containing protein [bacterium]|nr:PilZ domain-containing protein [bacterium]
MTEEPLIVRFASPEALRDEFEKNIANRGVFVETDVAFDVRQAVMVEIVLDYLPGADARSESAPALTLEGEVVHVVPVEMAASGAKPGVAVQFDASATDLRERFEPLLGQEAAKAASPDIDNEGAGRRGAKRGAVRVPVRVMPMSRPPFEATSRDLSATGILLSMKGDALPVGEIVRVCLWHPSGTPSIEIDGKVVRQVPNKKGRIAAVAVAFDRNQVADPMINGVLEALREAGHRSRLGGISGSLRDLGLANMLQMFGSSAPKGTLVVEYEGEQGWIAFAENQLLTAELGALSGKDALVAMLAWGEGDFQFEATVDEGLEARAEATPLHAAVLDAVCTLDEADQETSEADLDAAFGLGGEGPIATIPVEDATKFEIDFEQEELSRAALDKTEDAILELARAGMSVSQFCDVIPEAPEAIRASVMGLVEMGVLVPR